MLYTPEPRSNRARVQGSAAPTPSNFLHRGQMACIPLYHRPAQGAFFARAERRRVGSSGSYKKPATAAAAADAAAAAAFTTGSISNSGGGSAAQLKQLAHDNVRELPTVHSRPTATINSRIYDMRDESITYHVIILRFTFAVRTSAPSTSCT